MKTILSILLFLCGINVFGQKTIQKSTFSADNAQIWQEVEPFKNGFARFLKDDQFSFINLNGQCISNTFFKGARNFSNHLAAVQQNEKWGFINEAGQVIVPCVYDLVYDFNSNFTIVFKDSNWYKINLQGETIKQLNIDICFGFENEMPIVSKNGQIGVLNSNDDFIFRKTIANPNSLSTSRQSNLTSRTTSECPNNLDFENENFTGWSCFTGSVDTIGTINRITVTPSAPINNRHRIIRRSTPSAIDPYGLFSLNPPDGSNVAVRLGNTNIGAQAERISYKIRVPQNDSNFSIKYNYAVVFEDPNHTTWSQPRFVARLFDSAANAYVSCASFEYISTSSLPGFAQSTVDRNVIYKPWSSVFISMRAYVGRTMYIEFTTADCVRRGHWGYAYLDVESTCGEALSVNYNCNYPNITELNAPPGFQTYNWWNQSFSNLLANGENAVLNPGPPSGSILWLEMIPFNNFGCRDTVKVNISGAFSPTFSSSTNNAPCAPHTITFFNEFIPSTQVIWNFGDGTTGTGDTVNHTYLTSGNYQVTMTVTLANGCVGTSTGNVIINQPTGSFNYTGGNFCGNKTIAFNVIASNATSYTWEFGDGSTITTSQPTITHTYSLEGLYIPKVTINFSSGCVLTLTGSDSISIDHLNADFAYTVEQFCGYTNLNVTSISTSTSSIASYSWNFGNGSIGNGSSATQTFNASGTRNIKLIVTNLNGCVDSIIKLIRINVWNYPTGNITGPNNGCAGDTLIFNHNFNALDSLTHLEWFTDEGYSTTSNQANLVFNTPGSHWVSLVVVNNHGCSDTLTKSILIKPIPVFSQPQDISFCNGAISSAISLASLYPGGNFSWSNDNSSIGLANAGNWNIPSFTALNSTNTIIHANITITVTAQGCSYTAPAFMISVNPTPTVNQPSNQTICNGSLTNAVVFSNSANPNTTYIWQNNTPSIGLASSGNGNIAAFTAVNTSNASINASVTVTPQLSGCAGTPKTFNILVNPVPVVTAISNQTVCNGTQISAIQFNVTPSNAVINWTNTQTSIGLSANGTGNIAAFQATNTTGSSITAEISATPNFQGCVGNVQDFTIQVNPTPQVNQPSNQTICNGSLINAVVFSNTANPNTTYFWQNNTSSIGLASSGTGNIAAFTAINTSSTPITASITVTSELNGCSGTPKTFNILVNPTPVVSAISDQTVCNGTQINAIQFAVSPSNAVINWTNTQTSIGLLANGTGNISAFTGLNTSGSSVIAQITATPNFQGCVGNLQNFTIQVNPTPQVNQPANQTICNGSLINAVVFSNSANPNTTYIWQNNTPSIGLASSGTGNIAAFTASNTSSTSIIASITVTPELNGCSGTPKTFNILVNPVPVVSSISNQTVCNGTQINAIQFNVTPSNAVINWTNTQTSIGLLANGTGNIAAFQATNTTGSSITAEITATSNFQGCVGNTQNFTIQVNPTPTVDQPSNQTICNGSLTNAVAFTNSLNPTFAYSWQNNTPSIGLASSGTGNIAAFTALNTSNAPITANITVTPQFNGCAGTPKTFNILVNPVPVVSAISNQTVCNGTQINAIQFAVSPSNAVINWTNTQTSIGLLANGTGNIAAFQATNTTGSSITAEISATPNFQGCVGNVQNFTIQVNPTPQVNQPANQTICNGSLINAVVFSNSANPNTSYIWQNNTPSIGLASSGTGNIAAFTAANTSSTSITATITVTPELNGCAGTPKTFNISVNPTPVVSTISNQTVCNGTQINAIQFNVTPSNAVINWTNTQTSIGLLANGTGNIASFQATNTTGSSITAEISATPNFQGCVGNTQNFTIQVNPTPQVNQPANQQVCYGASTSLIDFNSIIPGTTYNWINNNSNIGMPVSGSGNISSFTPTNNNAFSDTAFISVMPVLNGCNGAPKSFYIAVSPNFNFTALSNQTYCNGQNVSLINFNSTAIGAIINWVNNNSSIGLASSGTGNILPFVATNSSNVIANANIIVTSTYLNCPAITRSFNLQVNPSLTIQQPANIEVCPGQTVNQIQFLGNVSGASYTWSNTNTNIGLAANGVGNIASFTALNNSSVRINAQITVIGVSNGCNPVQRIFSINVNPSPVINNILDVVVCHGKITDTIFLVGPNVGTQYSWTNSNSSIGLAPRGVGHIMPFVATNTTTQMQSSLVQILGETAAHCTALVKVIKIFVNPIPRLAANNDINVCRGSNASLSVSGANSYSWTPVNGLSCSNCSNPTVTASASTTYFIEGTNASGCKSVDSIKVNVNQPFDMIVSPNDTVCVGKSIQLNANRATRYQWSPVTGLNNPNIANPIATPSMSTTYTVVGYDAMGCFTDTASVYLNIGQNPSVNVGPDISAQTGSVITLNSTVQSGTSVSYNWSPSNQLSCNNCPNPSLTITGNQMLTLTVQNKYGCTAVDSLYIVTFCKNAQVFVANAFTPDGDNINDMLIVRGTGISVKSFRVFNRWGNVVFEKQHFQANDPKYGWNGKVNGVPATPDVYVYIAEVTCDNGTVYFHKGNTTILK